MFSKALIFTLVATVCLAYPGILEHSHATSYSNSNLGYGGHHAIGSISLGSSLSSSHGSSLSSLGNSLNSGWWKSQKEHVVDYHAPAHYSFKYGVEDHKTGDIKEHHESRDGDVVKGEYSLHEPDGTIRTVKYVADKHGGFQAQVIRHGHSIHPQVISHHGHGW